MRRSKASGIRLGYVVVCTAGALLGQFGCGDSATNHAGDAGSGGIAGSESVAGRSQVVSGSAGRIDNDGGETSSAGSGATNANDGGHATSAGTSSGGVSTDGGNAGASGSAGASAGGIAGANANGGASGSAGAGANAGTSGSAGATADGGAGGSAGQAGSGGATSGVGGLGGAGGKAGAGGLGGDGGFASVGGFGGLAGVGGASGAAGVAGLDGVGGAGPIDYCNVPDTAPAITIGTSTGASPTPQGGTLVSGTYYATSVTFYTASASCGGSSYRQRLDIVASSASTGTIGSVKGESSSVTRRVFAYSLNSTSCELQATCGSARKEQDPFSASPTSFTLISDAGACGTSVAVFVKQP